MRQMPHEPTRWPRVIIHADMDAFYAAVEQLDDPTLRGKPVIVGGPSRRGVVTTASYEARPYGVGSAMPMSRALRLCPDAYVVAPRFDRYKAVSQQIMSVFGDFAVKVEALSLDEAFLEMTGAEGLFGTPRQMGVRLKEAVRRATGLTVSVGVATTKFLAKVASDHDKPDGLTVVPPGTELAFLDPLPVTRLWGVGPKTDERLAALGLRRVEQVRAADPRWLRAELGSLGMHIYRLAHNEDARHVVSHRRAKSIGAEFTLSRDVRGAEQIKPHLLTAADRVARRLRKKSFLAGGLRVKLKTNRFELHTRQTQLSEPTDHADALYELSISMLDRFDLAPPMRLVGLAAFNLLDAEDAVQGDLFDLPATPEPRRELDRAVDRLRARFGDDVLGRASDDDRGARSRGPGIGEVMDD